MDTLEGLRPGRIVYYVFDEASAQEVMRRRTNGESIAKRMKETPPLWPVGAQAHVGTPVHEGDLCPAMVVKVGTGGSVNLKVMLDGSDTYWAQAVEYSEERLVGTW